MEHKKIKKSKVKKFLLAGRTDLLVRELFAENDIEAIKNMTFDEIIAVLRTSDRQTTTGIDWFTENMLERLPWVADRLSDDSEKLDLWTPRDEQQWVEITMKKDHVLQPNPEYYLERGNVKLGFIVDANPANEGPEDDFHAPEVYYVSVLVRDFPEAFNDVASACTALEPGADPKVLEKLAKWIMDRVYVVAMSGVIDYEGEDLFEYMRSSHPLRDFDSEESATNYSHIIWNW